MRGKWGRGGGGGKGTYFLTAYTVPTVRVRLNILGQPEDYCLILLAERILSCVELNIYNNKGKKRTGPSGSYLGRPLP